MHRRRRRVRTRMLMNIPPRIRMPMPQPSPSPCSRTDTPFPWDCVFECPTTDGYGSILFIDTAIDINVDAFCDSELEDNEAEG